LDFHKKIVKRGYIAMLAVDSKHRKKKIGSTLVMKAIQAMIAEDADEVMLLSLCLMAYVSSSSEFRGIPCR
jgi:peptide alpha-N-acetyltransferase